MNKALKNLGRAETTENKKIIDQIRSSHIEEIQKDLDQINMRRRVKSAVHFGRSNSFSFKKYKSQSERRIHVIKKVSDPNVLVTGEQDIANEFAHYHKVKTSYPDLSTDLQSFNLKKTDSQSILDQVLELHNSSLNDFFSPFIGHNMHVQINEELIKDTIKSMRFDAAPGPSGRGKRYYMFLFNLNKSFFTQAISQLLQIDNFQTPRFSWIILRKIIFIPKRDKDKTECANFRPISLLEVLYKIMSKTLMHFITPFLDEIVSKTQFGFTPSRTLNQASINTLLLAEYLKTSTNCKNPVLIFFDIKSAFDSIFPETVHSILSYLFPNSNLPKMINALTREGTAYCEVGRAISNTFKLSIGAGQGDPLSVARYNITHHLFISFISHLQKQRIPQTIPKYKDGHFLPNIMFADDTNSPAEFQSLTEVKIYLKIFQLAKLITGLEINPKKTQILPLKCSPDNLPPTQKHILNRIGNVTEQVNLLGLIITNDWNNSATASWQNSLTNFTSSNEKFRSITGSENPLHKKQLATALLQSTFNHVLRVHAPTQSLLKKFESTIIDAIWTKKYCGHTYGRVKISGRRITDPISRGGLGFKPIQEQAIASMISGGFNILQYCIENPSTFMAKEINLNMNELCHSGSRNLEYIKTLFTKLFPTIAPIGDFDLISKFRDVLALLEKDKKYFFRATLSHNSIFGPFDPDIATLLDIDSKWCIGSILKTAGPGLPELNWSDQIQTKMLEFNNYDRTIMNNVLVKLRSVSKTCPVLLKKLSKQKTTNFFMRQFKKTPFLQKL